MILGMRRNRKGSDPRFRPFVPQDVTPRPSGSRSRTGRCGFRDGWSGSCGIGSWGASV